MKIDVTQKILWHKLESYYNFNRYSWIFQHLIWWRTSLIFFKINYYLNIDKNYFTCIIRKHFLTLLNCLDKGDLCSFCNILSLLHLLIEILNIGDISLGWTFHFPLELLIIISMLSIIFFLLVKNKIPNN